MKFFWSTKLISVIILGLLVVNFWLMNSNLSPDVEVSSNGSEVVAKHYQQVGTSTYQRWRAKLAHSLQDIGFNAHKMLSSVGVVDDSIYTSVNIDPGMRREQVAERLRDSLDWSAAQAAEFARTEPMCYWNRFSLFHVPGSYYFTPDATVHQVEAQLDKRFREYVADIVKVSEIDNHMLDQAMRIASLLQREAAGNGDERIIAGIIWNRLYDGMELQLDATLQYAKGVPGDWWPLVKPSDKYIDSPYNTYQNYGLPPGPIASSDLDMVIAALNPEPTECYFYLHADDRSFYCAVDYDEHKRNIKTYL